MQGNVVLAGLSPHPPIIIPDVGKGEERDAINTIRAMDKFGETFAHAEIDTLVVITPHGPVFSDVVSILGIPTLEGDFGYFGAGRTGIRTANDLEFVEAIEESSRSSPVQVVTCLLYTSRCV